MKSDISSRPDHPAVPNQQDAEAHLAGSTDSTQQAEPQETGTEESAPPEPLTPERLAAENRRNDLFIAAGVILTAILLGSFQIVNPEVWLHFKSGWIIAKGAVPEEDPFAYSSESEGRPWVNVNWLYDRALYELERIETRFRASRLVGKYEGLLANGVKPSLDGLESEPISQEEQAVVEEGLVALRGSLDASDTSEVRRAAERLVEQAAAVGLRISEGSDQAGAVINLAAPVAVKALVLAGMAAVLLLIRHPGSTLWWTGVAATLALVGMSNRFLLRPEIVSFLLVAVTLWILHQFKYRRRWPVWFLVPLMVLWVNIDALFVLGIVLPGVFLLGEYLELNPDDASARPQTPLAAALGLCIVATLFNPFGVQVWSVPLGWTSGVLRDGASFSAYSSDLLSPLTGEFWRSLGLPPDSGLGSLARRPENALGLLVVVMAVGSFVVNREALSTSRALLLALFVGLALTAVRYHGLLALVAGVVLALNGQEWFQRRFGNQTRLSRGWVLWSEGGRAATIVLLAAICLGAILGRLGAGRASRFGYGVQWVGHSLETPRFLRQAHLEGRALNLTIPQGNLLIWAEYPPSQVFVDSRLLLHREELKQLDSLRLALRDDRQEEWEPILDGYRVSHVVLNLNRWSTAPTFYKTCRSLMDSPQWALVHIDSANAVFGRVNLAADHPLAGDAKWFEAHRFDPAGLVFKEDAKPLPNPPALVTPPTLIDRLWRTRRLPTSQTILAYHLLDPALVRTVESPLGPVAPTENCFLAIRAARRGLATTQVSPQAYAVLSDAYYYLLNSEVLEMQKQVEDPVQIDAVLEMRVIQWLTALNQLVTATPDSWSRQLQLARQYRRQQYIDLSHRHLQQALKRMPNSHDRQHLLASSQILEDQIDQVRAELEGLGAELSSPEAQVNFLLAQGCPGLAIDRLLQFVALPRSGARVLPSLARLYIRTGQVGDLRGRPGAESTIQGIDPDHMEPGMWEEMRAIVSLMQGDYEHARITLERALAETRHAMVKDPLVALHAALQGAILPMVQESSELAGDVERQARLEFYLGLVQLEAGEPMEAARHFKQAVVEVQPEAPFRPIVAFYLEKITGETLPPLRKPEQETGPNGPSQGGPAEQGEKSTEGSSGEKPEPEHEPTRTPEQSAND